jgi:hypothetical protein
VEVKGSRASWLSRLLSWRQNSVVRPSGEATVSHDQNIVATGGASISIDGDVRHSIVSTAPVSLTRTTRIVRWRTRWSDRRKLRRLTVESQQLLRRFVEFRAAGKMLRIPRAVVAALRQAAEAGHVLVVGQPGAGKSAILCTLVDELAAGGRDVVYLAADQLTAASLGELRDEIGIGSDLVGVLSAWPGRRPAYLVIDALDAARADASARTLRDLMALVISANGRWRVVASIREYDLIHAPELAALFRAAATAPPVPDGGASAFRDPEFGDLRHVLVPPLTDEELAWVSNESPSLRLAITEATPEFLALIRSPFNLAIIAELAGASDTGVDFTAIYNQVDLLDRYWDRRLDDGSSATDGPFVREAMLRSVCEAMVAARTMSVGTAGLAEPQTLPWALSGRVLLEARRGYRGLITFAHHILFDYATAKLLFTGPVDVVLSRLRDDPGLVVFARPSLSLYFGSLWSLWRRAAGRDFWEAVDTLERSDVSEVAKLMGAATIAEGLRVVADIEPLAAQMESTDPDRRDVGQRTAGRLLVAGQIAPATARLGPEAQPWLDAIERLTRARHAGTLEAAFPLLQLLFTDLDRAAPAQRLLAGELARRAWGVESASPTRRPYVAAACVGWVVHTYETDPMESHALLMAIATAGHVASAGYAEIGAIATGLRALISLDSELAEHCYQVVFALNAKAFGTPPTYALREIFPTFMRASPVRATRALVAAVTAFAELRRGHAGWVAKAMGLEEPVPDDSFTFSLDGAKVRVVPDMSIVWDAGRTYAREDAAVMLDAFSAFLDEVHADRGVCEDVLASLRDKTAPAVIWSRVFQAAARHPATLGALVANALQDPHLLVAPDLADAGAACLAAVLPLLCDTGRAAVEAAILSMPTVDSARGGRQAAVAQRDRLLRQLPVDNLAAPDLRQLADAAVQAAGGRPVMPLFGSVQTRAAAVTDDDYLAAAGVTIDDPLVVELREAAQPIREFVELYQNMLAPPQAANAIVGAVRRLRDELAAANPIPRTLRDDLVHTMTVACSIIARIGGLNAQSATGKLVTGILLDSSAHPLPDADSTPQAFDAEHAIALPAPRFAAAAGIADLASQPAARSPGILAALERLLRDPSAAVRAEVGQRVARLLAEDGPLETMSARRLVVDRAEIEESLSVIIAITVSLRNAVRAPGDYLDFASGIALTIWRRLQQWPNSDDAALAVLVLLLELDCWREDSAAHGALDAFVDGPIGCPAVTKQFVSAMRSLLTIGWNGDATPATDGMLRRVRERAIDLLRRIVCAAEKVPRGDRHSVGPKLRVALLDLVSLEVGFASGAWDERRDSGVSRALALRLEFLREYGQLLNALRPDLTEERARNLVRTWRYLAPAAPSAAFEGIAQLARSMEEQGQLTATSTVGPELAECLDWYLATNQNVFRQSALLNVALVDVLGILTRAGVRRALEIAFRLQDVFR